MSSFNIAIVSAAWHRDIVSQLADNCIETLHESQHTFSVETFEVPGVVEIPLFTQKLIEHGGLDAVVVAGLIADHGVYRHDFVARTVMDTTMQVQLRTGVPIIYGILTPQEFLSEGREEFFAQHFKKKGVEAAETCIRILESYSRLESRSKPKADAIQATA